MHEYDIALKSILTRPGASVLTRLTGFEVVRWHNSELPEVRMRRADLLGETANGTLVHVELQSTNDLRMAARMLEYSVAIHGGFGQYPEQLVLYVGEAPIRMEKRAVGPGLSYECTMMDIRELESEPLLRSASLEDNVIAVLARLSDGIAAVREILGRIAANDPADRAEALVELTILAGLRSLEDAVEREIERMPLLNDLMDHSVFGPKLRAAMADGRVEGERTVVMRQISKRFGSVPDWARRRLESLSAQDLEALAERLLDAPTITDLFN